MTKSVIRPFLALTLVSAFAAAVCAQTPPAAPAGSPVDRHGQLKVVGTQMLDKNNNPVQLRGMSLYWSIGLGTTGRDMYNANVVGWIHKDWNASLIRAAMSVESSWWTDQAGYLGGDGGGGNARDSAGNVNRVIAAVEGAITHGIYVIIDWHSHKAENYQSQAITFFQNMANRYKDYPNVIYEIYNEPIGGNTPAAQQTTWTTIKPYMQAVTDAIRTIDPDNLIIIGTPYYCQRPDIATASPVNGDNLLYAIHFYSATHKGPMRTNVTNALANGKAVFASEFGTGNADGGGTHDGPETDTWLNFLDERGVSWANWSLGTAGEATAALTNGATATPDISKPSGATDANWGNNLTASGSYIRSKLRGYTGSTAARGLPAAASHGKAEPWSVKRASGGIVLRGPEAGVTEIAFYDMRGKRIGRFLRTSNGQPITINNFKVSTGNYLITVRDRASNKEVYRSKISFVK